MKQEILEYFESIKLSDYNFVPRKNGYIGYEMESTDKLIQVGLGDLHKLTSSGIVYSITFKNYDLLNRSLRN